MTMLRETRSFGTTRSNWEMRRRPGQKSPDLLDQEWNELGIAH